MSSIAARRANKRACPLQPNGILFRGTHVYPGANAPPPRARRLAVRPAGSKQAAGWRALPGILAWSDGQRTPASRSEPLWPTLGETMGP